MALLSDEQRSEVWRRLMSECSAQGLALPVLKPEIRAAVDALDTWLDANDAAANAALPQPFRGAAGTEVKAMLMKLLVDARYLVGTEAPV